MLPLYHQPWNIFTALSLPDTTLHENLHFIKVHSHGCVYMTSSAKLHCTFLHLQAERSIKSNPQSSQKPRFLHKKLKLSRPSAMLLSCTAAFLDAGMII